MRIVKFLLFSILAVALCVTGALAYTTDYTLVTPNENLSLGYSIHSNYKLGDLKVTASGSFDPSKKVVVTVNYASKFINQSAYNSSLDYYLLVVSSDSDFDVIDSGKSFEFFAASIDAQQGIEIGTIVMQNSEAAADGFYMDELTFKASLDNAPPAVGDIVKFGQFTVNSTPVSLDWRVLSVDIDNKRALLITKNAVTTMKYHDSSNAWEGSDVRTWLKDSFLSNDNFTADEQAKILNVDISTENNRALTFSASGNDKMFLLSTEEARTAPYFMGDDGDGDDEQSKAYRTCTVLSDNSNNPCSWWLRSPGSGDGYAALVDPDGIVNGDVGSDNGVRPAFWLKF